MNNPESMVGTNRVVIKTNDNNKIIITRDYIDDNLVYMVSFTGNISYILTDIAKECGYIIVLNGLLIEDDTITIEGTIMENTLLKEEYHIINGNEFGKFTEAYIPYPEEVTRLIPTTLCQEGIKEMTGDLEMIEDMLIENILCVSREDLIGYNIIVEPELTIVNTRSDDKESGVENTFCPPLLTVIDGRKDKVLKK